MDGTLPNLNPRSSLLRRAFPLVVVLLAIAGTLPADTARHRASRQARSNELLQAPRPAAAGFLETRILTTATSTTNFPYSPPRTMLMEVTAYCPCTKCCGPNAQGITASGKTVEYNAGRFVAADTAVLPFGTRVSIPGYNDGAVVEVIDRGGAIRGNKLDVYFPTHEAARQWGRQWVAVTVE